MITWMEMDNETGSFGKALWHLESDTRKIPLPQTSSEYIIAVIETSGMGLVNVYIHRKRNGQSGVVGIFRR